MVTLKLKKEATKKGQGVFSKEMKQRATQASNTPAPGLPSCRTFPCLSRIETIPLLLQAHEHGFENLIFRSFKHFNRIDYYGPDCKGLTTVQRFALQYALLEVYKIIMQKPTFSGLGHSVSTTVRESILSLHLLTWSSLDQSEIRSLAKGCGGRRWEWRWNHICIYLPLSVSVPDNHSSNNHRTIVSVKLLLHK